MYLHCQEKEAAFGSFVLAWAMSPEKKRRVVAGPPSSGSTSSSAYYCNCLTNFHRPTHNVQVAYDYMQHAHRTHSK